MYDWLSCFTICMPGWPALHIERLGDLVYDCARLVILFYYLYAWLTCFAYWTSAWPGVRCARLVILFYYLYAWLTCFAYWTSAWPGVRFARLVILFYCLYDWLTCFTMYTSGYPVLTRYMPCRHASQFVRMVYLLCVLHVWLNSFTLLIECKPMSYVIIYHQCYLSVWCYNAIVYLKRLRQQIAFWLIPVFFLLYFQHVFNICWNEINEHLH